MYTPKELALAAAKALDDKKGVDIKLLAVTDVTSLADFFLICTGTSSTHVKTLCDAVEKALDILGGRAADYGLTFDPATGNYEYKGGTGHD